MRTGVREGKLLNLCVRRGTKWESKTFFKVNCDFLAPEALRVSERKSFTTVASEPFGIGIGFKDESCLFLFVVVVVEWE
jgi:hypothetical protein